MAQLLETLRNQVMTSIWGRRFGLDKDGFIIGQKDGRVAIEDFSTTAAASASPYGTTRFTASGSSQQASYTLQALPVGGEKHFHQTSTSTGTQQVAMPSGVTLMAASDGSSAGFITFAGKGAGATLIALSTALYAVKSIVGSSTLGLVAFTTST